jgi:hypothetical protein
MISARTISLLLAAGALGCSAAPTQSKVHEEPRAMAPPPACILRLPTRPPGRPSKALREEEYWELVFPSFEQSRQALPDRALACTGRTIFDDPIFAGATRVSSYPAPVTEGDILIGSGGDRLRVIWLRTHRTEDGHEVGPLALVRAKDDFGEVYAVGAYKGRTSRPLFQLERIGYEVVISVVDDECTRKDYKPGTPCESTQALYLPRKGSLVNLATLTTERRAFVSGGEPGTTGLIEYHLTAAPKFGEGGLVLSEQIVAMDPAGNELRHSELDRIFALVEARLDPNEEPLWPRIFPSAKREATVGDPAERDTPPPAKR